MNIDDELIEFLIKKCLSNNSESKSLFVSYNSLNIKFVKKVILKANKMGITDIYLEEENTKKEQEILSKIDIEQIENHSFFDKKIWNEYAKKNANFLLLYTLEANYFIIEPKKAKKAKQIILRSKSIYEEKVSKGEIIPVTAALPNDYWASKVFGIEGDSFQKLHKLLLDDTYSQSEKMLVNCNYTRQIKNSIQKTKK